MAGPSLMDTLFQRTLDDLIKGFRQQLIGESAFIAKAMDEIRREINSTDPQTKCGALEKLSYLSSLHAIDMSWAAFHVVEVMSSSRFAQKRIGYLAASQSFNENTPVLLLITNQLRKDLTSINEFEVSLALECLSRIATIDLSRDLTPEIFTLLSSNKVFVRKKAIGVVLRVFEKYPDAVRVCFKRLVENLDASDSQTLSAVVGVFCELSCHDPKSYLPLAPEFYRVLLDSKNNWVLIKVLKIFANLAPLEPRLAMRIVDPICDHMKRTGAKSLMFECIRTVVVSLTDYDSAVKLAVGKIRELLVDDDRNLKYLGLHALAIVSTKHLWAVLENKDFVIKSLNDGDPNIKIASLRLVLSMVSENNVIEICRVLVNLALKSDPEFCNEILGSILATCCGNLYEIIIDFDWYVSLLGEMSRIPHCQKGEEIEMQLIDIGMRVRDVRPALVQVGRDLLIDPALLGNQFLYRILSAAAWVSGEYVEFSKKPFELVEALLQPRTNLLPVSIRAVYIQSAFKVLIFCVHSSIFQDTNLDSPFPEILSSSVTEMVSESQCQKTSTYEASDTRSPSEEIEEFNPRVSNESIENVLVEKCKESDHGLKSTVPSSKNNSSTPGSVVKLLNFVKLAVGPLTGSHDVEILERSRNLLRLIELIEQKFPDILVEKDETMKAGVAEVSKLTELILDSFDEELGPVSVTAQERVPVPDGLMLNDNNLLDLDTICREFQLPLLNFVGDSPDEDGIGISQSSLQIQEESEPSNESTLLLSDHRKRHGLYYLPSEKNEITSNDYPPVNEPKLRDNLDDDSADLVKLTEESLSVKKKTIHAKPRPVVIKLDDGDESHTATKKPQLKDDSLSGAVRDILLGNDHSSISSENLFSNPSSWRKGKEKQNVLSSSQSKEYRESPEMGGDRNPSSRRKRHHNQGKERRHRSSKQSTDEKDPNDNEGKQKSSHRHDRHKARQRADTALPLASQSAVIPDFLL